MKTLRQHQSAAAKAQARRPITEAQRLARRANAAKATEALRVLRWREKGGPEQFAYLEPCGAAHA